MNTLAPPSWTSMRPGPRMISAPRMSRSQTAVAVFSSRARPGAPVSTPLRWDELLSEESADRWNVRTLPRRLASLKSDPWDGYFETRQSLTKQVLAAVE